MGNSGKRNGTIDALRILFCFFVLCFHISKDIYGSSITLGIFRHGALCVECFFIISGFFMCKSAYRFVHGLERSEPNHIGTISPQSKYTNESIRFIVHKAKPILFFHVILNLFAIIYFGITNQYSFEKVITYLPSFLFFPVTGFSDFSWLMTAEWYIGHMLFAMIIIYPFLIRWPDQISKYIAPLLGIILYGYLMKEYHSVVHSNDTVRAFAGISLGICSYHGSEFIKKKNPQRKITFISVLSFLLFVGFVIYLNSRIKDRTIQPVFVIAMWFVLTVTFSETGLLSLTGIFNNKFIYFLGKISLPIYMIQTVTRYLVKDIYFLPDAEVNYALELGVTIVCGAVLYYIHYFLSRFMTGNHTRALKTVVVCAVCIVFAGLGVLFAYAAENKYEKEDLSLKNENAFIIYYHETDNTKEDEKTTLVTYGKRTSTLTIEELGFEQNGKTFSGWKVFRPDTQQWRAENSKGESSWKKWIKDDESFVLYCNGEEVKSTVKAGHTVHFYAQWEEE